MHVGMLPEDAGVEIATVLMLRQLYQLVGKLHGADAAGIGAWKAELVAELHVRLSRGKFEADALAAALETVQGAFHTITDPRAD